MPALPCIPYARTNLVTCCLFATPQRDYANGMDRFATALIALLAGPPVSALAHQPMPYYYGGYGYGSPSVSRNGPPSPAQQMQDRQSEAYMERARQMNQPSPALRYQQAPPSRRYDSPPDITLTPIPESQRHPIVEEYYPSAPEWHRPPVWIWERAPLAPVE